MDSQGNWFSVGRALEDDALTMDTKRARLCREAADHLVHLQKTSGRDPIRRLSERLDEYATAIRIHDSKVK